MYFSRLLSKAVFQWIVPGNPEVQTLCVDPLMTSEKWTLGGHLIKSIFSTPGSTIPLWNVEGSVYEKKVENQCFRKPHWSVSTAVGSGSLKQGRFVWMSSQTKFLEHFWLCFLPNKGDTLTALPWPGIYSRQWRCFSVTLSLSSFN